jgi:hypothetical protein
MGASYLVLHRVAAPCEKAILGTSCTVTMNVVPSCLLERWLGERDYTSTYSKCSARARFIPLPISLRFIWNNKLIPSSAAKV